MSRRLFVAIRPPQPVRRALLALQSDCEGVRWQSDDQLHLTLAFIGAVADARVAAVQARLASVAFGPFSVTWCGVSGFTRKGRAKTLHALADGGAPLIALHDAVVNACTAAGASLPQRAFLPHVTLARLTAAAGPLDAFRADYACATLGSSRCDRYALYESHLDPGGPHYELLATYPATE